MHIKILLITSLLIVLSNGFYIQPNHNPFLQKMAVLGNNYVNRIAETLLTTAKNAISNCAGATAEVASKMADHSYTALRWKRSPERDLDFTVRTFEGIANDYEMVENKLNKKFKYFFTDSVHSVRTGFNNANNELVAAVVNMAVRTTPIMRQITDNFLRQMLYISDLFVNGIEDCFNEAELSSEVNVNQFAHAVSQVPNSFNQDMASIENCYAQLGQIGPAPSLADPYLTCAGGAVENMINRMKRDVVNVGLHLPTTAFGFVNIGSKASICLTDKLYTAKSRIDGLMVELARALNSVGSYDGYHPNSIRK